MPKITCITTTYNEGQLLLNAVQSVLNQSYGDFEYIIVDDGSQEETLAILRSLNDPRLTVITQANAGLSAARNAGIALAKGDYICFLDADDLRPNWSFAAIARAIAATNPDLVLCPGGLYDLRDQIKDFYDAPLFAHIAQILPHHVSCRHDEQHLHICALAQQIEPQSSNKVVRRAFLEAANLHFPAPYFFEDIFFHTLAIAKAERIAFLDAPAFTYFRRYLKPQITATPTVLRFDIINVAKLTLDSFARLPEFSHLPYRTAVLASCLKLINWCEASLTHPLRRAFLQRVAAMMSQIDAGFKDLWPEHLFDRSLIMLVLRWFDSYEKVWRMPEHIYDPFAPSIAARPAPASFFETHNDRITLQAFGEDIAIHAPKIDFLRADSLWRLQNIYQTALTTQTLAPCGVALDIGAGFGAFAVPFALAYPEWQVFCFEPDPVSFDYLERNIRELSLTQITALPFAIGHQNEDAPEFVEAVRAALAQVLVGTNGAIEQLRALLPLVPHSKSQINLGYLERGRNDAAEFEVVPLPTLAAAFLECFSPRLLKIIAPKVEADILSDLSQAVIDHVIGETWSHVPSSLILAPRIGQRQTWLRRAGTEQLALRKAAYTGGLEPGLDIILALGPDFSGDMATIDALLSDPSVAIKVLAVIDATSQTTETMLFSLDPRLSVYKNPNSGAESAWNFGRSHATATHISFVRGGDRPDAGFFSGLLDLACYTGAEVVQGPSHWLDGNGSAQGAIYSELMAQSLRDAQLPRFDFSDRSYHLPAIAALLEQPPSIARRVYRRDVLDRRNIWFPQIANFAGDWVFQTLSLRHLVTVPELDGLRFGQSVRHMPVEELADCALESFRILFQRCAAEGWSDFGPVMQPFAAQINAIFPKLDLKSQKSFIHSAAQLWAYAHKVLKSTGFDQASVDRFQPAEFASDYWSVIGQLKTLEESDAWAFFNRPFPKSAGW